MNTVISTNSIFVPLYIRTLEICKNPNMSASEESELYYIAKYISEYIDNYRTPEDSIVQRIIQSIIQNILNKISHK